MTNKRFQRKLNRIKKRGERNKQLYELKEAYTEYVPERKKRKVSNIILAITIIAILGYTVANFWIMYRTGSYMDPTFTTCFYAFWGGEAGLLAGIRVTKVIKENNASNDEAQG